MLLKSSVMDYTDFLPASWPESTRLWFYTSDQDLLAERARKIKEAAAVFLQGWAAHGAPIQATIEILHPCILVLAVFPGTQPSGCALDKASGFIEKLEQEFNLNLRQRNRMAWIVAEGVWVSEPALLPKEKGPVQGVLNLYANTVEEFRAKPFLSASLPWIRRALATEMNLEFKLGV
jgi:hypothetical protein